MQLRKPSAIQFSIMKFQRPIQYFQKLDKIPKAKSHPRAKYNCMQTPNAIPKPTIISKAKDNFESQVHAQAEKQNSTPRANNNSKN